MNIIAIPFHDWRKSKKEGFRTRDCHLINALQKDEKVMYQLPFVVPKKHIKS